jgi:hypothetical protein
MRGPASRHVDLADVLDLPASRLDALLASVVIRARLAP